MHRRKQNFSSEIGNSNDIGEIGRDRQVRQTRISNHKDESIEYCYKRMY